MCGCHPTSRTRDGHLETDHGMNSEDYISSWRTQLARAVRSSIFLSYCLEKFHNHQSITSATPRIYFGTADPGDGTSDRLSWDEVKLTADLVLDEGFDDDQFFKITSGPA